MRTVLILIVLIFCNCIVGLFKGENEGTKNIQYKSGYCRRALSSFPTFCKVILFIKLDKAAFTPNLTKAKKYAGYYFMQSLNIHKIMRVQTCKHSSHNEEMDRQHIRYSSINVVSNLDVS